MISKYVVGHPIETDAVVLSLPQQAESIPFFDRTADGCFRYVLSEKDIVYGLGEQVRGINKRGWIYVSNCADDPHHMEETRSLYGAHNFLIVSGEQLFGVFFDYPGKLTFDIGYTRRDTLSISAEAYDLYVYIITGENETEIVRQFRKLIGKSYLPPKWAFGYGQSRWGYKSADEIRAIADAYQGSHIPLDMIYLDIDYMERFKDFTVNSETFPDFPAFVQEMKDRGIHLVPIIDAGVKTEKGYAVYEEGVAGNYFCKDAQGKDYIAAVWPGRVHFPDVLNPDARRWFGEQYAFLLDQGIEGFWNDMNEPAIFYSEKGLSAAVETVNQLAGENIGIYEFFRLKDAVLTLANNPEDYRSFYHRIDGKRVRHDKVHNLYGYNMTRAAGEAFDRLCPDRRILLFSRASYIGAHRYGGIWQGDNKSWWSHLLMTVQMTCNLNMVGFLYTGADLGGFGADVTEDLLLRWLQFALFTPLMRNHSAMGTREQEIYRFENRESCKKMLQLRYALLPYLYSEFMKAVLWDDMMFKPLGFVFRDDISRGVQDQLLLGDSVMLAPVYTQNADGRYVWLPEEMMLVRMSDPMHMETEILPAGHHYVPVALDQLVFFIRKDRAIPLCHSAERVDALDLSTLHLVGYPGATYALYNDDGSEKDVSENNIKTMR